MGDAGSSTASRIAIAVEHLHAVVLAVGDIDPTIGIGADVVDDVEFALAGARSAPRMQQFAVRRIFVHARVAVAVRDVDLALGRQRGMSAAMKRLAAHIGGGLAGDAELEQHLPVECDLAHKMAAVIGQEHRVVGGHMHAMRPWILALPTRAQEIAGSVEHHHRVLAAVEDIDVVVAVDADPPTSLKDQPSGNFAQSALTR